MKVCHVADFVSNLYSCASFTFCIIVAEQVKVRTQKISVFRRNPTHCILPIAIDVCVCVCMPRLWTPEKRLEVETSFFLKLRGITPDSL